MRPLQRLSLEAYEQLGNKGPLGSHATRVLLIWFLVGNGGMDPCDSPLRSPKVVPITHSPNQAVYEEDQRS